MGDPACFNLPTETVVTAYLGLGSNVGDRAQNLIEALQRLRAVVSLQKLSSIYQSEPVGHTDQPEFYNMVVQCSTELPARQLLQEVLSIETAMGRERTVQNGPRNIDIDVLLYDDVVLNDADLQVPHARMHERGFVLRPLLEIAPDMADPRTRERYADTAARARLERAAIISPPPSGFR